MHYTWHLFCCPILFPEPQLYTETLRKVYKAWALLSQVKEKQQSVFELIENIDYAKHLHVKYVQSV